MLQGPHECLRRRRVHVVEVDDIFDAKLLQGQDDGGKIGSLDLWITVFLQVLVERTLREEAEALAGAGTTSSTSSLLCTCPTNGTDEKRLDSESWVVDFLLGETWVNHVDNTIDGQGSFGDIGRYNDFATGFALSVWTGGVVEDAVLLLWWQGTVKGNHRDWASRVTQLLDLGSDLVTCLLNLLLTSEEKEDISRPLINVDLQNCLY